MKVEQPEDFEVKKKEQIKFISAIRGLGGQYIADVIPTCVKVLISECHSLGETLLRQTLRKFSVGDGRGGSLIEFHEIVRILQMFRYNCTTTD